MIFPVTVKKFGGKLLSSMQNMQEAARIVAQDAQQGKKIVVVVSAMSDTTDKLVAIAHAITQNPAKREYDALLACGEQQSMAMFTLMLSELGCPARSYTGFQAKLITRSDGVNTKILSMDTSSVLNDLEQHKVVVIAGFQGMDDDGNITTLGRGGSDLTAVAVANFLHAKCCEFYKDTGGVYTIDPHIIANSHLINAVSYDEMLSISYAGAKLLQTQAVKLAKKHNIQMLIMDWNNNRCGTLISSESCARNLHSFYSMVEDNRYRMAKLTGYADLSSLDQEIISYAKYHAINLKIMKTSNSHYLVLLDKDIDKIRKNPVFEDIIHDNIFKKLSIITPDINLIVSLCQEVIPARMFNQMEFYTGRRKNTISLLIYDSICQETIVQLHHALFKKLF